MKTVGLLLSRLGLECITGMPIKRSGFVSYFFYIIIDVEAIELPKLVFQEGKLLFDGIDLPN